MTKRQTQGSRLDWLKVILVIAVLLAVFAGTEVIARNEAALPAQAPALTTELVLPGEGEPEKLMLPPVATAISIDQASIVARSRSSR